MFAEVTRIADRQGGVFLRHQAVAAGVDLPEIYLAVRKGSITRVRRGAYVDSDYFRSLNADQRHAVRVHAVCAALQVPTVVSGVSAAVLHGLDLWKPDLDTVTVSHPKGMARLESDVRHLDGYLPDEDVAEIAGLRVVTPARAVLDIARTGDVTGGTVAADCALNLELTTPELIEATRVRMAAWSGARTMNRVADMADGGSQSVLESLSRIDLIRAGLPRPELQVGVFDATGELVGIADMVFREHRTVVEVDGTSKYGIDGRDVRQQLIDEKVREDRIRSTGLQVVRLMHRDLGHLSRLRERLEAAFERGRLGPPPTCELKAMPRPRAVRTPPSAAA